MKPVLLSFLALLAPSFSAAQTPLEAFAAATQTRGEYAEMRLQQVLCELPADDSARVRLGEMFDTAKARHLEYTHSLLLFIDARKPNKALRRQVASAAARADSTMLSFDAAARDARIQARGIPPYALFPLVPMATASDMIRSLYRGGSRNPEQMRHELDPPRWKSAAEVRSLTNCSGN
jgi:hypothetical protein